MFSEVHKRVKKAGQPPGTLIYTGTKKSLISKVTVVSFDSDNFAEKTSVNLSDCNEVLNKPGVKWVNVEGLNDLTLIKAVASQFNLHPLTVEDILNVDQRPKVEEFESYIFVTLKVLDWKTTPSIFVVYQLSLVIGKDFVLSFQEADTDRFDNIREKLHGTSQRLREASSDYLAYRLIDTVVDEYFLVLESVGDDIEKVEDKVVASPTPQNARTIYKLKRQMLMLRKAIWPMREAISHLLHLDDEIISKFTRVYLRDVYDHTMQAIDTLETFRDMLGSLLDMYLSSLTNRMNEIMKTLTIITTIFIPITAIASFYGMNFPDLPGIKNPNSYLIVLLIMILVAFFMLIYFRKRKWI